MRKPLVVALHGPQRSGKNEIVRLMDEELYSNQCHVHCTSFSSPFKSILNGIVGYEFTDDEKDLPTPLLGGKTPRDGQIYLGTMDQHFGGGLWAHHAWIVRNDRAMMITDEQYLQPECEIMVYESVGRQGQWDYYMNLREKGDIDARLVEVVRPGFIYKDNRQPIFERDPSKTFQIRNIGTVKDLKHTVREYLVPWLLTS